MTLSEQILIEDAQQTISMCKTLLNSDLTANQMNLLTMRILNCEETVKIAKRYIDNLEKDKSPQLS